jgi:Holliday junction resolvasome RuvABC endonuclease subunit
VTYSVLALDQSARNTGWAHMVKDQAPTWGLFQMGAWEDQEGERLLAFEKWFDDLLAELKPSHCFIEKPFELGRYNSNLTEQLARYGIVAIIAMACSYHKIELATVTNPQWRAKFLGAEEPPKGLVEHQRRAWLKDKSKKACLERGWLIDNDNVADALGILNFGVMTLDPIYSIRQGPLWRRASMQVDNEKRSLR